MKVEPLRVGRFILLEQLGTGSMGEIFAAYDEQLHRRVELRLVRHRSEIALRADELLLREAQALAQVSHPNVVQIYEAGTHEGRLFIAMDLVCGQTLTRWLHRAARLSRSQRQREILRRFIMAGRGLEAAHAAGVVHRDFKPDNVLVGVDDRVRVVDFGLARALGEVAARRAPAVEVEADGATAPIDDFTHGQTIRLDRPGTPGASGDGPENQSPLPKLTVATRLTETGTVIDTPQFMAPEQLTGTVADDRGDQFSFCVALYHALYGAYPFAGDHVDELLDAIRKGQVGLEHSDGLAVSVRKALRRGLSYEPSQRYANMGELLAMLESGVRRRGRWIAGTVLLSVALALGGYAWSSQADLCASVGDGIDRSWSAERHAAVHSAFMRSLLPYAEEAWTATRARLDAHARRWRDQAHAACRAANVDHTQSTSQFDRRMLCLDRDRRLVDALVSELSGGAPEAVQGAVEAAERLSDLQVCSHAETMMFGLEAPPDAVMPDVSKIRDQIARARVLEQLGRPEDSLVIARQARVASEQLKYPPVHAEALFQVACALDGRGNAEARKEAEGLYFEALDVAEATRHDVLVAQIWNRLVLLALRMDSGSEQVHAWLRRNEAAIRRTGESRFDEARLHHLRGEILYRDGNYGAAADEENRAITMLSELPEEELELSRYYDGLAKALERQPDRLDEALRLHERAVKVAVDVLGPKHPDSIKLQINHGIALRKRGDSEHARQVLERALDSMPTTYRSCHIDAGRAHGALSDLSYAERKLEEAAMHARESFDIYKRAGAPRRLLAEAYVNLANIEIRRKNFRAALSWYEDTLAIRRQELNPNHYQIGVNEGSIVEALVGMDRHADALPHALEAERILGGSAPREAQAWVHMVHGEVLVGQHQLAAAVPVLEQAISSLDDKADHVNSARAMWALARALNGLGKDPARVLQLAKRACDLFSSLGTAEQTNRDAVQRFIERLQPVLPSPASQTGGGVRSNHNPPRGTAISTSNSTNTPPAPPPSSNPKPESPTNSKVHSCDPSPSGDSGDSGTGRPR